MLLNSDDYLRFILLSLPGHVYWKDKQGKYLGCNKLQAKFFGASNPAEIVGKSDHDLLPIHVADQLRIIDTGVMNTGTAITIEERAPNIHGEEEVYLSQKIPLLDLDNNIIGILGVSFNITGRKYFEESLQEEKEKIELTLENIINHIPAHIYWKDTNFVIQGCNEAQAISAGFKSPTEMIGKTDDDMPWYDQAGELRKIDNKVLKSSQIINVEEPSKLADGRDAIFYSIKAPLKDKTNHPQGIVGISIDITKQKIAEAELIKAKEAAELANKAKDEFIENMRHDFITPLSGIIGFADLILAKTADKEIRQYITNLKDSGSAFLKVLNDVFERIRLISDEANPVVDKKFNLHDTLKGIIDMCLVTTQSKGLNFKFDWDNNIPNFLVGDVRRIHRILLELTANALKFTTKGDIRVSVQVDSRKNRDIVIKFIITDTGIGIPEEKCNEIYVAFRKLRASYKGVYNGIGMGLTIVKKYIEDLDGEIYVNTAVDKGTEFICYIPLRISLSQNNTGAESNVIPIKSVTDSIPVKQDNAVIQIKQHHKNKVLVVEDNVMAAKLAKSLLEDIGCAVDIVHDGISALKIANSNLYHMVLMDIGLPDISGIEVTKQIRKHELAKNIKDPVPIFAFTAHKDKDSYQECYEAGMYGVFEKPLSKEKTLELFASFIPGRSTYPNLVKQGETIINADDREYWLIHAGSIIDKNEFQQIYRDKKLARECLDFFIMELGTYLAQLHNHHKKQSWLSIQKIAHSIDGSACYCAATRLRNAAQKLERYIRLDRKTLLEEIYQSFIKEIHLIMQEYGKFEF